MTPPPVAEDAAGSAILPGVPHHGGDPATADPVSGAAVDAVAAILDAGDARTEDDLVPAALVAGPATGRALSLVLDAAAPGLLAGRAGRIYPLLHRALREGRIEARWVERVARRPRREYALPGGFDAAAPVPVPPAPGSSATASPSLDRAAREASGAIADPFAREEARAEVLDHLVTSARAHVDGGGDPSEAAREALKAFGDPWAVRGDLARVHRGRRVVVFPRTFGDRAAAVLREEVLPILFAVGLILFLRWKVVQAYNIPTKSMEPTLYGSADDPDYILVNKTAYWLRPPERWDIVVFYPPHEDADGERTAFVKRCVGLAGDVLDIRGGDVYVDGRLARRPDPVEDAMLVEWYDLGRDLREAGTTSVVDASWREAEGAWRVTGERLVAVPSAAAAARLEHRRGVDVSYRDARGARVSHYSEVGDLEVRAEVIPATDATRAGVVLTEGEERFRLLVGPEGVTLDGPGIEAPPWRARRSLAGRPVSLRLRNVDDRVTAWVDGERAFRVERPPRTVVPLDAAAGGVALVVEGDGASFGGVRILRDILYQRGGRDAAWPVHVPDGHLFMMGDNTSSSNDSRMWGPVRIADVIGSPSLVIYPFSRARSLR